MRKFFAPGASVRWHNTNEAFSAEEFIEVNCEYPGAWDGEVERVERIGGLIVTAVRVFAADRGASFHVVSSSMCGTAKSSPSTSTGATTARCRSGGWTKKSAEP